MPGNGATYRQMMGYLRDALPSHFEADQLFLHLTGLQPVAVPPHIMNGEVTEAVFRQCKALAQRRKAGEPLQYLLGEWEFYGLPMWVGEGVLIPRADTEILVDQVLAVADQDKLMEIVDLCSGSGCIAIALAHHLPLATVTALELSGQAFHYLEKNIARNGVRVRALQGDVREYIHPRQVDILVSNPPYIPKGDMAGLQMEVRQEPELALCGGEDGLDFYRIIAERYLPMLRPGGAFFLEVGIGQSGDVASLLRRQGAQNVDVCRDYGGIERVVYGTSGT